MNQIQMQVIESNTAYEYLDELREHEQTHISGELVELFELTDSIDIEDMREAIQWAVQGDNTKINGLYITEIKARM